MTKVFIAAVNCKQAEAQFSSVSAAYPTKFLPLQKLGTTKFESGNLIIVDFEHLTQNSFLFLKNLKFEKGVKTLGIIDNKNRTEVLQAREIGFYNLADRDVHFSVLLVKLREILGDYSKPTLSGNVSERLEKSVLAASAALSQMSMAVLANAPMPVPKLAKSAKNIAQTIETEGIDNWLSAVQSHHSHTYCHTMMVTGHTISFSKQLGLPETRQYLLGLGALVHDLGKIKIPLSILDKPGRLTQDERTLVNKHPHFGREILKSRKEVPKEVVDIAVWHHEMLDGSGYPDGLSGDKIPKSVRMVTITDIYSASD